MNAKAIFLLSLALVFIGFSPLMGQSLEDSLYNQLESTHLVVRLPSQAKKLQAMRTTMADSELSESARTRLQTQLENERMETNLKNRAIIEAFERYFDVLPVVFVYDTTRNVLQADFLNEDLKAIDSEAIGGPFIQLRFGHPVLYSGSGAESMVLTDSQLRDLGTPFPKPVMMTGFGYGFNKLVAPEMAFEKLLEKRVKKLDRKLGALLR
jgi:hypothetical protein